jgi:uncharacterized sulfatase
MPAELDGVNLLPHLTGKKSGPPHETLYWRWVDQAAVLEYPHKLLLPGGAEPLLVDITDPDNERLAHDLSSRKPEIASRLGAKLDAWLATLHPPGGPEPLVRHRLENFVRYDLVPRSELQSIARPTAAPEGSIQGWFARNGSVAIANDVLTVVPEEGEAKHGRLFLSRTRLDLVGPVTVAMRLRSETGGRSTITWRTRTAAFTPEQVTTFDWPVGPEFQEVTAELAEAARIIHLRVTPPRTARGLEIESIQLRDARGQSESFEFGR